MIATHNIKVNGRWIHAGEEYEAEERKTPKKEKAEDKPAAPAVEEKQEEKPVENKPKTAARRKKMSE